MTYFVEHYDDIRLPVDSDAEPGLRRSQRGAIHAVAAHFTLRDDPAIVVMPTGSGKTAVLMLSAFFLRATRVLVVTPSRLVRSQIVQEFKGLRVLREARAVGKEPPGPKVEEVDSRVASASDWEAFRSYDVVVGTPYCVSPAMEGIPPPPADLFDLVLVDEAHHSPAKTWNDLLAAFPEAKRVLFTATPFRRDRREIRGRFVYTYPIAEAFKDRVFGEIAYVPVEPDPVFGPDVAVARKAEEVLREDRSKGLAHFLMVRTDSRKRAEELKEVYANHTGLKLQLIHSGHSYAHVRHTIGKLKGRELDGVICVNMLGEGFDFPNLKLAAVHSPHKSLAATLQFIGRFARTNSPDVGQAKFLAVPSDEIKLEAERLFEEGAVWQQIVHGLIERAIEEESRIRQDIESFEPGRDIRAGLEDLSLYSLRPYHHVKVYRIEGEAADVGKGLELPSAFEVVYHQVSEELSAAVFITQEIGRPRWTHLDLFEQAQYDLFVVYYDPPTRLLFICSSRRENSLYERLARQFTCGRLEALPYSEVDKALLGLEDLEFFNVGMRNRVRNSKTESYRTITGSNAHRAIRKSDGRLYHQGHVYGRARDGKQEVTIGLSSSSKVWSNTSSRIPQLVGWCRQLAERLSSEKTVVTRCELDYLGKDERVTEISEVVIAADWGREAYDDPPLVWHRDGSGGRVQCQLIDLDLVVDRSQSNKRRIRVAVGHDGKEWLLDYSPLAEQLFAPAESADPERAQLVVCHGDSDSSLIDYLNEYPLAFYLADFSRLEGRSRLRRTADSLTPFPVQSVEPVDWEAEEVDIRREFGPASNGKCSIHDYLKRRLLAGSYDVVLYDHGSGEVADFLTGKQESDMILFEFYHCKGSKKAKPGDRVDDVYEVCGQVVKSAVWVNNGEKLLRRVKGRVRPGKSTFLKGDLAGLYGLFRATREKSPCYRIVLVQPAISASGLSEKLANILAAANDHVQGASCEELWVLGSP